MKVRLTVLCENTAGVSMGVIGEHGFACFIEVDGNTYLFDTGQGLGILENAAVLGADLTKIDAVMISHGHYDHTGGLPRVLSRRGAVPVYGHPEMFADRLRQNGETTRYIGIPYKKSYLTGLGADFRMVTEITEIGPGLWLTGEIPRNTPFEKGDANLVLVRPNGERVSPDPVADDLSLVIDSPAGLIIVLGCAHAGMVNILDYVVAKTRKDRIYAVLGGTHLGFSGVVGGEDQFEETVRAMDRYRIDRIGVSHCTGQEKAARLQAKLGDRFFFANAGARLEV